MGRRNMKDISKKINDIKVVEYIYQLKISKCIKDNKLDNKELIKKVEYMLDIKEDIIKKISK